MEKLVFVFNADSGLLNTVADIGHKIFSPQTYDCGLCMLTHGKFSENDKWKKFRENSPLPMEFFHKDEFEDRFDQKFEYPCVLAQQGSDFVIKINKEQIGVLTSVDELISRIEGFLAT